MGVVAGLCLVVDWFVLFRGRVSVSEMKMEMEMKMKMEKEESLGRREKERVDEEVREKTIKKYLHSYSNRVYLHGYCSKIYIYKLIHPLMWVVFGGKCVNLTTFCIIHRLV